MTASLRPFWWGHSKNLEGNTDFQMTKTPENFSLRSATNKVIHARKIWKVVQSVIEKKILTTIDEYNRNYNYERTEKKRCESKNCDYVTFMGTVRVIFGQ